MEENDLTFEYTDIDNLNDVSDVYSQEVLDFEDDNVSEEIVTRSEAESSAPSGYDDTVLLESIDSVNESILGTYEYLSNISHRIDQSYDLIIAITLLLGAFIAISVFRKLFDWLA